MQTLANYLQTQYNPAHYLSLIQQNAYSFDWFANLASDKTLHPTIVQILETAEYAPADLPALIGEYPHVSRDDAAMIAYCQSEDKAKRGIYTRGKMGKYLARHFPTMGDDAVRRYVSHWQLKSRISIVDTVGAFIHTVLNGPSSCMASDRFDIHPYNCYAPEFGWRMAVRRDDAGNINGRALINGKTFVRAYVGAKGGSSYCADTELQDYLTAEGYTHAASWPRGTKLALIEHHGRIVAPYIDGCRDQLNSHAGYLTIEDSGEYAADNTDGYASGGCDDDDYTYCEDCNDRVHLDETYSVGIGQDRTVCDSCMRRGYTCVEITMRRFGRQYRDSYYVPDDETITVNGTPYHENHMPDDVVQCFDDEWRELDDCVYIESADAYYPFDDSDIVQLQNGDYELRVDAWQCAYSDEWYSACNDDTATAPDGAIVHPDNMRAYCTEILGQSELEFDEIEAAV